MSRDPPKIICMKALHQFKDKIAWHLLMPLNCESEYK